MSVEEEQPQQMKQPQKESTESILNKTVIDFSKLIEVSMGIINSY